jgi:dethiobiotin synthetase
MSDLPGLLVVGTDTGVGKTRIASAIARALVRSGRAVGVLKPVATGATAVDEGWKVDDADRLIEAIGGGASTLEVCPIAFDEPLAPPVAARRAGSLLEASHVFESTFAAIEHWRDVRGAEVMVVEGVGGLLCPLAEGLTVADLAVQLDYPLVIVARRGLGTLNHTLLTVETALARSLRIAGVILNGAEPTADPVAEATNPAEIARRLGLIPVLADFPYIPVETRSYPSPLVGEGRVEGSALRPWLFPSQGERKSNEPDNDPMSVVMHGLDWYNRASRPRLPFPRPMTRGRPMSSSGVLHPQSGTDADLDAFPVPPFPPTPDSDPLILDEKPLEALPLGDSESGDLQVGSSTFSIPAEMITPDPIFSALAGHPQKPDPAPETEALAADPVPAPEAAADPVAAAPFVPAEPIPGSFDALGRLDINATTSAPAPPRKTEGEDEDEVVIEYVSGPSWPIVLLASYASAATLALLWWVILPRIFGKGEVEHFKPDAPPTVAGTRRGDHSKQVEAAATIPDDRITTLGKPLKVGSLEITPLNVNRTDVTLVRKSLAGKDETRRGGGGAQALRLRLKNTSNNTVFAPLDESFLRDRDDGRSESFVELDNGERVYLYPLPIQSEWSIVGQTFPDLRPGEVKESRVISATEFPASSPGSTWRIKVRTGVDKTETIGVKIPSGG